MRRQAVSFRKMLLGAAIGVLLSGLLLGQALAQNNGGNNNGGNNNGGNNNNNNNGNTPPQSGIAVDAQGVLRRQINSDLTGALTRERLAAAKASLPRDLATFNAMRKVSLTRLEKALKNSNGALTDEMRYLAGLLRVQYVFFYPESKDIVLAGPAEGWVDVAGQPLGVTTFRPTLQLQDLVVALRAFPPDREGQSLIGCSIDPTPEGLTAMQRFLRSFGSTAVPSQTEMIVANLTNSLGPQTISVDGVSPKTHFAQVMVEADYRMKLIGIGKEHPPVKMISFVDKVNAAAVSRNALFRWYFVPDYQCVRVSKDGMAMELVGDGVKLVGEDELVSAQGGRRGAGKASQASQAFCTSFTQKYSQLAERAPVYAQLRNVIDLSMAAAFIQGQGYYDKADWKMEVFGSEKALAVETYNAPKQVESAVNAIWKGNRLITPIGGGVQIEPTAALKAENLLKDDEGKVAKAHRDAVSTSEDRWWWD